MLRILEREPDMAVGKKGMAWLIPKVHTTVYHSTSI